MGSGTAARLGFAPPPAGPGVCATCQGPVRDGRVDCWCCRSVARALGARLGVDRVVPIAVFGPGDPLHVVLRGYKDAAAVSARGHFAQQLTGHFRLFLDAQDDHLAREAKVPWDCVAVVPSSGDGAGASYGAGDIGHPEMPHPLEAVVGAVPALSAVPRLALRRGPWACGHLAPDARAFAVPGAARGRRVLLVDDTWVTGSRMVSAAAALESAGATVVAMVVAGRLVERRPSTQTWWARVAEGVARGAVGTRCALAPFGARSG